jgi:Protein of unknown function (DUF3037)
MADERQLEFFLLRYVPNAVKDEFVNLGLVLIESGAKSSGFVDARFIRDWRRVRCLDPDVDIEMLEALEREVQTHLQDTHSREVLLKRLTDSFSNLIQVSPMKACLAVEPAKELETLANLYVEAPLRKTIRIISGRQQILAKMRDAFEQAGVWKNLMHSVPVTRYTKPGDPLKFDFAYRIGESMKIFHAVSLKTSVDQAVIMASRYPSIAKGIYRYRNEQVTSILTTIVDDALDRKDEQVQFALAMMNEAGIQVEAAARMPAIAEMARQELTA